MHTLFAASWRAAILGRWTARVAGTLLALFFLAFLVAEGPPPLLHLGPQQLCQFLGMSGLFLGLLLAWKWEGLGGLIALVSFAALLVIDRRFNSTWFFQMPAAVAVLHLACWARIVGGPPAAGPAWEVPRRLLGIAGILVGAFILLCANEIFGNPPLMAPPLRPSADLIGHWHAALPAFAVDIAIAADGSVAGSFGDTPIHGGHIRNNRSWFGRLMHWREPYQIRGDGFAAPVAPHGQELRGSLFIGKEPYRLTLRKQ